VYNIVLYAVFKKNIYVQQYVVCISKCFKGMVGNFQWGLQ